VVRVNADVVMPFHGTSDGLEAAIARLARLRLVDGDTVTIVDNTRDGVERTAPLPPMVRVLHAPERQSSYHARNRGAADGRAPWIVFLDADVVPEPGLLDGYLAEEPGDTVGVLAGRVHDASASAGRGETLAERYARLSRLLDQRNTLDGRWPYAQTANCAVRRVAFAQAGGFVDDIRSGGDADLCFRLRDGGWALERREGAVVEHRGRDRLVALLGQRARHGSGAEWLAGRYPGFVTTRQSWPRLASRMAVGAVRAARCYGAGDRDEAVVRLVGPLTWAAFQVGRGLSNSVLQDRGLLRSLVASVLR
jgi:GT2 family glycosyltransferase